MFARCGNVKQNFFLEINYLFTSIHGSFSEVSSLSLGAIRILFDLPRQIGRSQRLTASMVKFSGTVLHPIWTSLD